MINFFYHFGMTKTSMFLYYVLLLSSNILIKFTLFQANIGQNEDFEAARRKAEKLGAKKVILNNKLVVNTNTGW